MLASNRNHKLTTGPPGHTICMGKFRSTHNGMCLCVVQVCARVYSGLSATMSRIACVCSCVCVRLFEKATKRMWFTRPSEQAKPASKQANKQTKMTSLAPSWFLIRWLTSKHVFSYVTKCSNGLELKCLCKFLYI